MYDWYTIWNCRLLYAQPNLLYTQPCSIRSYKRPSFTHHELNTLYTAEPLMVHQKTQCLRIIRITAIPMGADFETIKHVTKTNCSIGLADSVRARVHYQCTAKMPYAVSYMP
jgi:hypothetical protein